MGDPKREHELPKVSKIRIRSVSQEDERDSALIQNYRNRQAAQEFVEAVKGKIWRM